LPMNYIVAADSTPGEQHSAQPISGRGGCEL
jgi:hypothetical protein